ncbi:MAG: CarD family transcriptional regulator [Clostridia bacterium]|nr:CarD family transcriptional regulator [Clostridia bacterium]
MYQIGDRIVHPLHGAGIIEEIVTQKVDREKRDYYLLRLPENNMDVLVPVETADRIGIRPVGTAQKAEAVFGVLRDYQVTYGSNCNARYHENINRIKSGDLEEVAKVIKILSVFDREKGLASGERKMLHNAKKILFSELALILDRSYAEMEANLKELI